MSGCMMIKPPIDLKVNCFQLQSIRSHEFLEALKSFNHLLFTSIGPNGHIKIIKSSGGITILTTSSKRMIDWIEFDNPLLLVISNAMKSQLEAYADFGLYSGLTSTTLLLNVLNDRLPSTTASPLIKYHSSVALSLIDELRTVLKVDFSSLEVLMEIVGTVIASKPLCCDPAVTNVVDLAVCVAGAFIRGLSEKQGSFGKVSVVVDDGPVNEPPKNFTGLLYDSPESLPSTGSNWNIASNEHLKIMVVLFAVNLTASNDIDNNSGENFMLDEAYYKIQENVLLEKIENTCEKLLDAGVRVFACQKVVHPHVMCFLQRRGALALERMGKELADSFALLTGALPLGCPTFEEVPDGCIGELESVKVIEKGEKTYLCLERDDDKNGGIVTILASAAGEQQAAELKVVIFQSLETLRHLASKPYVLPGSGCLETWLAVQLQKRVSKKISGYCGSCFIVDSFYNHCWQSLDAEKCACGLLTKEICGDHGVEWIDLEVEANEEALMNLLSSKNFALLNAGLSSEGGILYPKVNFSKSAHVDVYSSKLNALSLALEICQSILSIGMVVY